MQSIRTRQLTADLSYNGTKYTTAKPWDLATGSTLSEAAIATEAYVTAAVAGVSSHTHVSTFCYVDSNRAGETYTETGSEIAPYRTLSAAIDTKLADGQTATVVFILAPGTYTGAISRDKESLEQAFEIRGSGAGNCFIRGSAVWDATVSSVLYFRDFISVRISGVTIYNGAYGIYTRSTLVAIIEDCEFSVLGSSGINHGFERTQAQMAADWATQGQSGSNRSDGGVMRIRGATNVVVRNCKSMNTLRGIRLQNCTSGRIVECTVRRPLESSFYLASGSYTGSNGCHKFLISDCVSEDCFNNAFLVIGGTDNSIVGCRSINTANSAVTGWHTQGLNVSGCVFEKAAQLAYNGIGNLGDSWGGLYFDGATALVDTEGYMLCAVGNSFLRTGLGRHTESVCFFFNTLDETLTSYRAVIDNNNTDATTAVHYEDSNIPLVNTHYPDVSAIAANAEGVSTNGSAIESLQSDLTDTTTASSQNTIDVATNANDIGNKQDSLVWATVGDDHETRPVTSKNIKAYVDANAGGSGATLGANTFTANQEIKANSNVKLTYRLCYAIGDRK